LTTLHRLIRTLHKPQTSPGLNVIATTAHSYAASRQS